mgnify:CR=1 FL=1
MATTLEIVTALQQAAANCYDGSHDERFAGEDLAKKVGLNREEGCAIKDSRVIDGFNVRVNFCNPFVIRLDDEIILFTAFNHDASCFCTPFGRAKISRNGYSLRNFLYFDACCRSRQIQH